MAEIINFNVKQIRKNLKESLINQIIKNQKKNEITALNEMAIKLKSLGTKGLDIEFECEIDF